MYVVARARNLGIGRALGAHLPRGGLGGLSPPPSTSTPAYYARAGSLRWTSASARQLHDDLVGIDRWWRTILGAWHQIPFVDGLLATAGIKRADIESIAYVPCPGAAPVALCLELAYGGRALDDALRGTLRFLGASYAAAGGIFTVAASVSGVVAVAGGIESAGISVATAGTLAAAFGAMAGAAGAVSATCFAVAGGNVDCGQFKASVTAAAGATGHDVSDEELDQGCAALRAAAKISRKSDPAFTAAMATAKEKSKQKTAVAEALAKSLGVSYAVLFKASATTPAVATWVDDGFRAATAGAPAPAPSSAVVAAVPGARSPRKIPRDDDADDTDTDTDAGADAAGTGVPLEQPGVSWWKVLAGAALAAAGVSIVVRIAR